MFSQKDSKKPFLKVVKNKTLLEILEYAENYCEDCEIVSPMICVERCDVWKVKNEVLEIKQRVSRRDHISKLFNVLKNERRLRILDALIEKPRSIKELQKCLSKMGFQHSRSTISNAYINPLLEVGLIKREGTKYRLTFYGRNFHGILRGVFLRGLLPIHSCCYEEIVLRELKDKPKTFNELAAKVPSKSLSRVLARLRKRGLIRKNLRADYVFYHKVKGCSKVKLSPTEKRMFKVIPKTGISARNLSKEVEINLRRTYKYLRRLKAKKLVFALKMPRTYELTEMGVEIAQLLEEITLLSMTSLSTPMQIVK
jgi:predicted transcriptional regulator